MSQNTGELRHPLEVMGKEKLIYDERFIDNHNRTQNYDKLESILNPLFETKNTEEWIKVLEEHDIPCSPVNKISDMLENEQIKAREVIQKIKHPQLGEFWLPGLPIKFSKTPGTIRTPAPELGEHNDQYKR